jgi:hypothetical protein
MSVAPTQAGSNDEQSAGHPDDDPGGAPDHELGELEDVIEVNVRLSGGFIGSHHWMEILPRWFDRIHTSIVKL